MQEKLVNFLLVEDEEDHANLVIRNLKRARVVNQVDHVTDGEAAIRFLKKEGEFSSSKTPDIVLLDLKLPKVDGHEVLSFIRKQEDLKWLPVVILTTSAAEADRAAAYLHHANSYLIKPLDFEQFRQMVDDLSLYWGVWNQSPPAREEDSN